MDGLNHTRVTHFVFMGLTGNHRLEPALFVIFGIVYLLILAGNLLIVVTVASDRCLRTPMYFFLGNLSFLDICHSSVTAPKMLSDFLSPRKTISFDGCLAQLFFLHLCACAEIFLLTVMAYDRYLAICHPLQYMSLMSLKVCARLVGALWLGAMVHSLVQVVLTVQLPYCGANILDSFFCDVLPVIQLACTETYVTRVLIVSNSGLISLVCFLALLASYINILVSLRGRPPRSGARPSPPARAHLLVVTLFLGPCIFLYTRPAGSLSADKVVAVFYTIVTPVLNPVIYTLRNAEMKNSMKKLRDRQIFVRGP